MSAWQISICVVCQLFLVVGQLFLKHGMGTEGPTRSTARRVRDLIVGIVLLSIWFFLWLGVLQQIKLSQAFPFEGLNPALLVLGAWIFLKERIPAYAWIGIVLISVGVALVSAG